MCSARTRYACAYGALLLVCILAANVPFGAATPVQWCDCFFAMDPSGTLKSIGSCPTCSDPLYLGNRGIKALSADVFANKGAMTCVQVVASSRDSHSSSNKQ